MRPAGDRFADGLPGHRAARRARRRASRRRAHPGPRRPPDRPPRPRPPLAPRRRQARGVPSPQPPATQRRTTAIAARLDRVCRTSIMSRSPVRAATDAARGGDGRPRRASQSTRRAADVAPWRARGGVRRVRVGAPHAQAWPSRGVGVLTSGRVSHAERPGAPWDDCDVRARGVDLRVVEPVLGAVGRGVVAGAIGRANTSASSARGRREAP